MNEIIKILKLRWLQHLGFWVLAFYVLLRIFAPLSGVSPIDVIYTLIFITTMLPGIYLNLLLFIPRFLSLERYLAYAILLVLTICATAGLNILTFTRLTDIFLPGYYFISYFEFSDLVKFGLVFTGITTLLKLSKGWFMLMETRNQLAMLEKRNAETRLEALKNQVNPHFLFNSLAGIYSLVLQNSAKASEVVLRLSGFLRYVLYETSPGMVGLSKELAAMTDYVELQKLRAGKDARISIVIPSETGSRQVAPLLFLPLIENCFKHGIKGSAGPVYAKMIFSISGENLEAYFENNKGITADEGAHSVPGIGLANLRDRLELLYPLKYKLIINTDNERFTVKLTIPLHESSPLPGN